MTHHFPTRRSSYLVGHELGSPGHRASTYRRGPRHPAVRRAIPAGGSAMMSDESVGEGYLAGQILIAMPSMSDPRFARTVIYLCAHNADGAMGLVLNRVIRSITFGDLLEELQVEEPAAGEASSPAIHFGGTVETGRGFVLHSSAHVGPDSMPDRKSVV